MSTLPQDWRDRMPIPVAYYTAHLTWMGSPNVAGWAQAPRPLYDDHNNSLSVRLIERGAWRCERCGGGDLIGFHMRLKQIDFRTAVLELILRNRGAA